MQDQPVGVIGAGSFGIVIAKLLSENTDVIVYARSKESVEEINFHHAYKKIPLSKKIKATTDLSELAGECKLIFPIVPSANFRKMMSGLGKYTGPSHILIHGTKKIIILGLLPMLLMVNLETKYIFALLIGV